MRESLFISEGAALPAIGDELAGLQPAAGTTTKWDTKEMFGFIFGLMGELSFASGETAGFVRLGVALSMTSEVMSAIPSGSQTAQSSFQTTYTGDNGLKSQFAAMVSEAQTSWEVQNLQVRRDGALLDLVSLLRSNETWMLDEAGMESAANQAFSLWVYKALIPTIYDRYKVTNCWDGGGGPNMYCSGVPPSVAAFGNPNDLDTAGGMKNFVYPGAQFNDEVTPCKKTFGDARTCIYYGLPNDILGKVWVPPTGCIYVPGDPGTSWKFTCPIGDDPELSVHQNSWGFNTYCGNPRAAACAGAPASASSQTGRRAPVMLGRTRHGQRRAARGRAQFRAEIGIPPGLRLAGAKVGFRRLLFELRGHGELTRTPGSRAPRPLVLSRTGRGRFGATARSGRPRARIVLRRLGHGRASLTLTAGARAFRTPLACHALPASVALETSPLELETRLTISNGRARHRIVVPHHMRCRRDAYGNIDRLVYIRNHPHSLRPGLALTLRGPRRVQPGTTVRYLARVHNRRRTGGDRLASSLWQVALASRGPRVSRIRELRAGRSRRLVITVRVPRAAKGRFCAHAIASAPGAPADKARACARVRAARRAPEVTG
jgi:hypothetical protein